MISNNNNNTSNIDTNEMVSNITDNSNETMVSNIKKMVFMTEDTETTGQDDFECFITTSQCRKGYTLSLYWDKETRELIKTIVSKNEFSVEIIERVYQNLNDPDEMCFESRVEDNTFLEEDAEDEDDNRDARDWDLMEYPDIENDDEEDDNDY